MNKTGLYSQRLHFRLIDISDLKPIHYLHSLPETDEFNTLGIPKNTDETKLVIEPWILDNEQDVINNYTFAIEQKATTQFIGLISLRLGNQKYKKGEVWYKLDSAYWGKGFGTESLTAIIDFGFDKLNLHRIEAGCAVDNKGSIKVLEKAGMTKEGRKRQILPLKSGWSDNFEYAILETDKRVLKTTSCKLPFK